MSERGRLNRREFLSTAATVGAAAIASELLAVPGWLLRPRRALASAFLLDEITLEAALRRMIPADGPNDWDAFDAGALDYVKALLLSDLENGNVGTIFAGGPFRSGFSSFQVLSAVKHAGWRDEISRLRGLYTIGLQELNARAGGDFASLSPEFQDAILVSIDLEGDDTPAGQFFRALYHHTMEGVYGHPVYGGNTGFVAWSALCYQGDVHGVRFPNLGDPQASWNVNGGYAPEEMIEPGTCPGQGPET